MDRHEQRRHEAHQLAEIEREIVNADRADAARDAVLLRAMVAIGKITFARFDSLDEQLDRIEEKIGAGGADTETAAQLAALTARLTAADAKLDAAAPPTT